MKQIQFSTTTSLDLQNFDTLIVPVFEDANIPKQLQNLALDKLVKNLIKSNDFKASSAKTLMLITQEKINRICLVGVGKQNKITDKSYLKICQAIAKEINQSGAKNCLNLINSIFTAKNSGSLYQATLSMQQSQYDYIHPSRGEHKAKKTYLEKMVFFNAFIY